MSLNAADGGEITKGRFVLNVPIKDEIWIYIERYWLYYYS